MKKNNIMLNFFVFIFLILNKNLDATLDKTKKNFESQENEIFKKNFYIIPEKSFYFAYARNYPTFFTRNKYAPGIVHPVLGFRYVLSNYWWVGISSQYKFFYKRPPWGEDLVFWTLSQDFIYWKSLSKNVVGGLGLKSLYLMPVEKGMFPFRRIHDIEIERGAGISMSLMYFPCKIEILSLNENFGFLLETSRWRGTDTSLFHGFELLFGLLWKS